MKKKSLIEIYNQHIGKLSDKWSLYIHEYDFMLSRFREKPINLLEIGVQNGGSLEIWSKFFPQAKQLVGCDIDAACANLEYQDERVNVVIGDANQQAAFEQVTAHSKSFDIIIDDGSHTSSDIIRSFQLYFPLLETGGIFCVEDLHCSYWPIYEGGILNRFSSMAFFKQLADVLNHEHWGNTTKRTEILRPFFEEYGFEFDVATLDELHSIEFVNSMCILRKRQVHDNTLGSRVIRGEEEIVVAGHLKFDGQAYKSPYTELRSGYDLDIFESEFRRVLGKDNGAITLGAKEPAEIENKNTVALLTKYLTRKDQELGALKLKMVQGERAQRERLEATQERHKDLQADLKGQFEQRLAEAAEGRASELKRVAHLIGEIEALRLSTSWRSTSALRRLSFIFRRVVSGLRQAMSLRSRALALTSRPSGVKRRLFAFGHRLYRTYLKKTKLWRRLGEIILRSGLVTNAQLVDSANRSDNQQFTKNADASEGVLFDNSSLLKNVEEISNIPGFHLSRPLSFDVDKRLANKPKINVLLPSVRMKHMSGGPNTALLLAAILAENGEEIRLFSCDSPTEGEEEALYSHLDSLLQRPVSREHIEIVDSFDRSRATKIGKNDVFFATAWWTAQIAKYAVEHTVAKEFIYLIQDFEPVLHEGSTFQARALETYGLPHIPVINTKLLLDHLVQEKAGKYANSEFADRALCFEPALDRRHYHVEPGINEDGKNNLLFYARPNIARRNLYELGVVALRHAVASGVIDSENWNVWAMGEKLEPVPLGKGVFLNPLPWMSFEDYAKRVRTADLLLSPMLSPHPSYPPLEMAASGNLVVTNSFSVKTAERLAEISPNILVAEPTAIDMGQAIELCAGRINAGVPSFDKKGNINLPSDWDQSFKDVIPALMGRLTELRLGVVGPRVADGNVPGLPAIPQTEYERFRLERLAARRASYSGRQQTGLLSFITTVFDTQPQFLMELAESVFHQDGGTAFEWYILDNGSNDDETRRVLDELAKHPCVRLARVEENLGIIGGMRLCLEKASGQYVLPLDSDDLLENDCVLQITRNLIENGFPSHGYTDEDKLDAEGFGREYLKPDWDPVLFLHSCYIAHLCVFDRTIALEIGVYSDQTAEGCHDWDTFIRFMNDGHKPIHIPDVLYSWRMHNESTSANIGSKNYITDSHRATLGRMLAKRNLDNITLETSPLFNVDADWFYARRRDVEVSCCSITLLDDDQEFSEIAGCDAGAVISIESEAPFEDLERELESVSTDFVHLRWSGVEVEGNDWLWDAASHFEMFPDAVMVGGALHDGTIITDGPIFFGFGNGIESPDTGRSINDPGYGAGMWKARSVSAVSLGHCVVRRDFLRNSLRRLAEENVPLSLLAVWLGAYAAENGQRVIYSPFMRAKATVSPESKASTSELGAFLSAHWSLVPDSRYYSRRMGLTREAAYQGVSNRDREVHILELQKNCVEYSSWLHRHMKQRAERYKVQSEYADLALVTAIYSGSDFSLFEELFSAVVSQTLQPKEWMIVVNGPMKARMLKRIEGIVSTYETARLIVEEKPIGIVASLRLGVEAATAQYFSVIDADDLVSVDAVEILQHEISRLGFPDLVFSDEDLLVDGVHTHPFFRSAFDPVLAYENSTIWHMCAAKRDVAIEVDVYGDPETNWCQDWDLVSRFAALGKKIEHIPEVLYHWRQHSGSTTNNEAGDIRSLDSVRFILKRHISRLTNPEDFYVKVWPEFRGAKELYIAQKGFDADGFVWFEDFHLKRNSSTSESEIVVVSANTVRIDVESTYMEVSRIFSLYPDVAVVGGVVFDDDGVIVEGCSMFDDENVLADPWRGHSRLDGGPFAQRSKVQSVVAPGNQIAFFRVSALKDQGLWPLQGHRNAEQLIPDLAAQLALNEGGVVFSPLVRGTTTRKQGGISEGGAGLMAKNREIGALTRYGASRPFST